MNSRKRDYADDVEMLNRTMKSARLESNEHLGMVLAQSSGIQPVMPPTVITAATTTYPTSTYPLYQTIAAMEAPPMTMSMQHQLLHAQASFMPALLSTMPNALSHQGLSQALTGDLTLDTDQFSPYCNTSPIDHPSLIQPSQRALDGYPTPEAFEVILNDYIMSLSPKKQDKALIPQKRYDNILLVLRDPKCTTIESAQFRFWAKKMFRLGDTEEQPNCELVLHETKPVAVRENLYQVLTTAHGACQHGGRDKTSAQVRRYWSWVPKELIARFVRYCPTCVVRRNPSDYHLVELVPHQSHAQHRHNLDEGFGFVC